MKHLLVVLLLCGAGLIRAEKLEGWQARGGKIEKSVEHYKSGTHSLQWIRERPDAVLTLEFPAVKIGKIKSGSPHFGLWLYNQTPGAERLQVEVFSARKSVARFWFSLNFSGWRPLGADYLKLGIPAGTAIDRIVFTATGPTGTLWLDSVKPLFHSASVIADDQQPWASDSALLRKPAAETIYSSHDIRLNRPYLPEPISAADIGEKSRADIGQLEKFFLNQDPTLWKLDYSDYDGLKAEFEALNVREENGIVSGPPVEFSIKERIFLPAPGAMNFKQKLIPVMRKLATAAQKEDAAKRRDAEQMFVILCRYLLDQGYQEGNNNMGWPGPGYDWKKFPGAVIAMRGVLQEAGLLEPMAKGIAHFCGGRQMLSEKIEVSVDDYYNYSSNLAALILILPDQAECYQRLRALKRFYDLSIQNDLPFAPDGTIHHHWGHHLAYGSYTIPPLIKQQLLPLKNTEFAIAPESVRKLQNYARALNFQVMNGKLAPNLVMRSGVPMEINIDELLQSVAALDDSAPESAAPSGHLTLNTAAIAIQRRDDWQAAAAAMNNRFRGLEIYGWLENNNYGRYARNGTLFLTIDRENGWRSEGWDHNFWPGGTNPVFEPAELFEGYRNYHSQNPLAGGVTLDADGIWGVDFNFMDVKFKKSMFFFDNRITVITTDITPLKSAAGREVVTTLFQQVVRPDGVAPLVNGREVAAAELDGKAAALLRDNLGNSYYIYPGAPLKYRRTIQEWTYFFSRYLKDPKDNPAINIRNKQFREKPLSANAKYYKPTSAEYDLAYFEHGKDPDGAACAYTVLVNESLEALNHPPAQILQQNADAHVVYDAITKTTGYVVFNPANELPGPLKRIDGPAFIMIREQDDDFRIALASDHLPREYKLELRNGKTVKYPPENQAD